jgi:hypothetical protein
MQTYTFVMQYLGCTYTSQVSDTDINRARKQWLKNLCVDEITRFTMQDKQRLINDFSFSEAAVKLGEMVNVWHFFIDTNEGTGYVTIILSSIAGDARNSMQPTHMNYKQKVIAGKECYITFN